MRERAGAGPAAFASARNPRESAVSQIFACNALPLCCIHPRVFLFLLLCQVPQDGCMGGYTTCGGCTWGQVSRSLVLALAASRPVAHQKPVEAWPAPPFETPADGLTGTPSPPCHPPPSLPTTGVVSLVASSRSTTPASASCPSQMRQDVSAGSPPFPRSLRHRIHPHRCRFAPTCACPPPPVRPFPSAPRTASPRRRPTPPPRGRPRQIPCR